jgi:hypothetical protein
VSFETAMPKHYQKQQQLQQQISKTTELEFTLEAFYYCLGVPIVVLKKVCFSFLKNTWSIQSVLLFFIKISKNIYVDIIMSLSFFSLIKLLKQYETRQII